MPAIPIGPIVAIRIDLTPRSRCSRVLFCLAGWWLAGLGTSGWANGEKSLTVLQNRYAALSSSFEREMQQLARQCEEAGLPELSREIAQRGQSASRPPGAIDELPAKARGMFPPDLPETERIWRTRQLKLEQDHAIALYRLSRDALQQGHYSLAFKLVREVAYFDPDHKQARTLLGFKRVGDEWTTPFAAAMTAKGQVFDPQFGWLPKSHLPRYRAGERNFNGKWISAEREANIRSDFNQAWEIDTEHFRIRTNHSLEEGVRLGAELERFHGYFVREFATFFSSPSQLQRLFDQGEVGSAAGKRYSVYYFRSRDEYLKHLSAEQPGVAISNGLYLPRKRIAYFFYDPAANQDPLDTMYHEVTHQLLAESSSKVFDVAPDRQFWIVEGFACYMESYRRDGEVTRIGEGSHPRFFWARERLVKSGEMYEFASFCALGMADFQLIQDVPTLQKYYAQGASMCHFFLNYEGGMYRDAFLTLLTQIYSPNNSVRAKVTGLDVLTGVPYPVLEQQYRDYLQSLIPAENP